MRTQIKAFKAAFPHTIPILIGFSFLGIAYGLLMKSKGYGFGWTVLMSMISLAGSAQYVAITFLTSLFNPLYAFLMSLMINARHLFYGISMLERYKNTGKFKPFLIFGLCDETFSILCSAKAPQDVDENWFMFFVTFLNYIYWQSACAIGSLLGNVITFNTKGLDFVLTALFIVIFIDQWKSQQNHIVALTGIICTIICLLIFGQNNFIIPSMIAILTVLSLLQGKLKEAVPA